MKNNFMALIYHLGYILLCLLALAILVFLSPLIGNVFSGKMIALWPVRIGMAALIPASYIWLGSRLKPEEKKNKDFLTGGLITVLAIILVMISMRHSAHGFWSMPSEEELTYHWQLPNLFLLPTTLICFFLDIVRTPWIMLGSALSPSFLMGIGLRWKRNRIK